MSIGVAWMKRHKLETRRVRTTESQTEPSDFSFLEPALKASVKLFSGDLAGLEENVLAIKCQTLNSLASVATSVAFAKAGNLHSALQIVRNLQCFKPFFAIQALIRISAISGRSHFDYARQMADRVGDNSGVLQDINRFERRLRDTMRPEGPDRQKIERLLEQVAAAIKKLKEISYSSDLTSLSLQLSAYSTLVEIFNELLK